MEIFSTILELLDKNQTKSKELIFGNYKIIKKLGKGEQGLVLKIENKIQKNYALKFYSPVSFKVDQSKLISGLQSFKKEIFISKGLNHKNIVKIVTGGCAKWIAKDKEWEIEEGFDNVTPSKLKTNALFYIMDF